MFFRRRAVLLVFLIAVFVVLLNFKGDYKPLSREPGSFVAGLLDRAYQPIFHLYKGGTSRLQALWKNYLNLVNVSHENDRLRAEVQLKDMAILSLKEKLRVAEQEDFLVGDLKSLGWDGAIATVTSYDPLTVSKTIWVDAGSDQGVQVNQPVMTSKGLVGRIVRALPKSSQVLLLIDKRFAVDILDEATRTRAMVLGLGDAPRMKRYPFMTQMEYLKLGDEVHSGDLLITSGLSDMYPRGIPVGSVMEITKDEENLFQSAAVMPLVDFAKLEQVIILTKFSSP